MPPPYAELHCLSNFTFLRGASHPEELVARAHALGYEALALTDECSLAGVVRAHVAAKTCGLALLIGTEVRIAAGPRLVLLATDRDAYGDLSALITAGRRRAGKGRYHLRRADLGLRNVAVPWWNGDIPTPLRLTSGHTAPTLGQLPSVLLSGAWTQPGRADGELQSPVQSAYR